MSFEKIAAFIDNNKSLFVELESLLTSIPALAPESGGDGELEKCLALESWLKQNGFTDFKRYDAPDNRVSSKIRPNLVVTVPANGKTVQDDSAPNLWIMSHLDVVPSGEIALWQTDPFKVVEKEGKLFGRGTEDDQQGLVCSVMAALALIKENVKSSYNIKLLFVADEEVGSAYGIQFLADNFNLFKKDDLIITPDGGDPKGETIEIAEKNLLWLRIKTLGKQAHGSMPDDGINAHLANCGFALKLHDLENFFEKRDDLFDPNRSTFQPTKKESNVPNINTIPGEDIFYMDCRILPFYSLETVREKISQLKTEIESEYGVKIEITESQAVESPATDAESSVVKLLSGAIKRVLKIEPRLVGIGGGTVGAYLRKKGLNVVVWSKQDETMHQPNEYCVINNLLEEAKVLASMMIDNK